jgi:hypothetical protein
MMVVLVDKLVKTQIVECSAVANWIFSSELGSELTNFYVWEILTSTIEKMNRQVEKNHAELLDLRRQLNISATVQAVTNSSGTVENNPSNEQILPTTEETKMDESENPIINEEQPTTTTTNNLKRRRESDDEDDEEQESTEKVQAMQISKPPMDEATAKLHEKYEIVEERLLHAREQQK